MATLDFDVIVVGGGVAGATCAALLAQQQRRVGLVDARRPRFKPTPGEFDARVVAISPGSQRILEAVGAWPRLDPERRVAYRRMSVHAESLGVNFDAAEHGLPELGWIAEIPALEDALWQVLEALERVATFAPIAWETLQPGAESVRLSLRDGRTLRADLLVAADGSRSRLRSLAGLYTDEWHYNQRALIGPVTTEQVNRDLAWQRFTEHGPLALLPLPDGRSSIVWSQPDHRAEALLALSCDEFITEINDHQDSPLGKITAVGQRHALPLIRRRARRLFRNRIVLLGDAARSVHPLAGQGLNLGLTDAAALAEVLDPWRDGSPTRMLERYQRWRQSNGSLIGGGIHAINELVRTPGGLGRHALGAGFGLASGLWPLREAFVRRACGLDSDSPRLARTGQTT
ncbi:MAG: FAD-dependent monooxygenase [Wenzhouxiangella sp.]|jgi:ubiquinone biosynthesis UbiH/UbiF/VisC/COQ6 family hydroxylase|nr:FAD-dependent monooxygenase [Wenzhouxiangella sp.]